MSFNRQNARKRRHRRIRKKLSGTAERPRLCVRKSLNHLTAQIIDDVNGRTLVGLSTHSTELRKQVKSGNVEGAKVLGKIVAEKAKANKIDSVIFDRGGHLYHGRIQALAEAVREAGLQF